MAAQIALSYRLSAASAAKQDEYVLLFVHASSLIYRERVFAPAALLIV